MTHDRSPLQKTDTAHSLPTGRERWLTSVAIRYRDDAFYRTKMSVIALQIATCAILIYIIVFLYIIVTDIIDNGIMSAFLQHSSVKASEIVAYVEWWRLYYLIIGIVAAVVTSVIFGYLTAVVALRPARHALESQKQFIRNVAHELRTPLSVIKTDSEVTLMTDADRASLRETLRSNAQEVDRLSEIVSNLFAVSILDATERPRFTTVDLGAVAAQCIDALRTTASDRGVKLVLLPSPMTPALGNKTALEQILTNVLKNALIYTEHGGSVTVSLPPAFGGYAQLLVQDTGIGISKENLLHIFEPFFRADSSRSRTHGGDGGLGIGLTIAYRLVKLQNGAISVRSYLGEGTSVSIRIPVADYSDAA